MDSEIRAAFARRLRHLMDVRGLSTKSLVWAMGDTPEKASKVNAWLRGESVPSLESLLKLCRALRCDWEELLGEVGA